MTILIALSIFIILLVVIAFFMRNNTLNKLKWEPGETVIQEFSGVSVKMNSLGPRTTVFLDAKLVFTQKRVLICQKLAMRDDFIIHYILKPPEALNLEAQPGSIVQLSLASKNMNLMKESNSLVLNFPNSNYVREIQIDSDQIEPIHRALLSFRNV